MRPGIWHGIGLGGRAALQLAYVVLAARALGPEAFGGFVATAAAALVAAPLCGWGANALILRALSRGAGWNRALRDLAIRRNAAIGSALAAVVAVAAPTVLGVPWQLVLAVVLADLLCGPLHELAAHALQAAEDAAGYAAIMLLHGGGRCAAAVVLVAAGGDAVTWGWCYAAGAAAALATAWLVVHRRRPCRGDGAAELPWGMGGAFVGSGLARVIISDGDKLVLAALAAPQAVAVYGLAMRGVEAASIPLRAAIVAWVPRFFRAGAGGGAVAEAARALPVAIVLGLVGGAALAGVSPLLPLLLGAGYAEVSTALLLVAPLVPIRAVQAVYGEALTGSDRQWPRTLLLLAAGVAATAGTWLVLVVRPGAGWSGPALVQLGVACLLAAALALAARPDRVAAHA